MPDRPLNRPKKGHFSLIAGVANSPRGESRVMRAERVSCDETLLAISEKCRKKMLKNRIPVGHAEAPSIRAIPKTLKKDDIPTEAATSPIVSSHSLRFIRYPYARVQSLVGPRIKLIIACAASLLAGLGLETLGVTSRLGREQIVEVIEESRPEPQIGLAATARRNEPILPLIPFELNDQIVKLGNKLFHDPALSGNGRVSCASCHIIESGGDDGRALSSGVNGQLSQFNAPTVLNAAYNYVQFWDGRAGTLEEQIDGPLHNPAEMDSNWERVTKYLEGNSYYNLMFQKLLGGKPTPERVRTAIATFERSLITRHSRFDQWLEGNEDALSADEYAGYHLFKKYNCVSCHQGIGVGGNSFQKLGAMKGYFADKATKSADLGRFNHTGLERDRYVFRVPQLRNVELTAPYFHDGSVETLEQAVAIMIEYQCGEAVNREEVRRMVEFLKTLTGCIPNVR